MELLLDETVNLESSDLFNLSEDKTEKRKRCPICNKKMDKVELGQKKKILIDKCKKNHGLWFDENELHEAVEEISSKENKILELLNDMFNNDINRTSPEEE